MLATSRLSIVDLARQKPFQTDLTDELTPEHDVEQAMEHYLDTTGIPDNDFRWSAFSHGVRLDRKIKLKDLPDTDSRWLAMPEVAAG